MKKRIAGVCAASAIAVAGFAGPAAANHGGPDPLPPHCEHGQERAALNAAKLIEKDPIKAAEKLAKHELKAGACLLGFPPRSLPVPLP